METEKKYIVDKSQLTEVLQNLTSSYRIDQYYLNDINDSWLIRARSMNDKYFLTLKSKGLLSREELEYRISPEDFEKTIWQAKTKLGKTRHHYYKDGHLFEIDIYDDYDFVTCEIEFSSEEDANAFDAIKPAWCLEDITYDKKYKNVNLAK